jgi:hypothetical protein
MQQQKVQMPVTYMASWNDGFGARGWKLDCSIGEPSVIAATAEAGQRIPTSVLVHDIVDHHLCGVDIGGHRNEAVALIQLQKRTGSDPLPDFTQIINEDLMHGRVNGESLRSFIPDDLKQILTDDIEDDKQAIAVLCDKLGEDKLRQRLLQQFVDIGHNAEQSAQQAFESHGLDYSKRSVIGLRLQGVLSEADQLLRECNIEQAHAQFWIDNQQCGLDIRQPLQKTLVSNIN